ncbi:acyltransferase family protein [Escherichia coli]|uniref:acyltransferase family protein n=2 Tax=Escherichia coli TaxID=562 RepID=UPI00107846D2|nr:acyltransferase [Escherichia coli]EAA2355634.1 acyltransferase [Escherichia coli]EER7944757.1 acyltransferase [Escherichia coli]EGD8982417.1 acyltransferase [Escherichia coli]EGE0554137.1 acyltransferase [Escherichia coli]
MIKKNLESIQFLRAVAVLLVVLFHYRFDAESLIANSKIIFFNGSIGVDLFFVISGFIIYYVTDNNKKGIFESASFILKRVIRVLPPYLLISFIFVYFGNKDYIKLIQSISFIPLSNKEPPFYGYPSLVVGWSLNYEIYFYILAAIGIMFFGKCKWLVISTSIVSLIMVLALINGNISLSTSVDYNINSSYLSMATNSIILDFTLGVACGYLAKRDNKVSNTAVITLSIVSIAIFIMCLMGIFRSEHGPMFWGLSSFFLVLSFIELEKRSILYFPKILIVIGNMSFSIYLVHIPCLVLCYYLFNNIHPLFNLDNKPLLIFLSSLIATCISSFFYYHLVERYLCEYLRKSVFSALFIFKIHSRSN